MSGVRLVAWLTGLMGVLNILSAVLPSDRVKLPHGYPLEVAQGAHTTAALAGFGLLLLARSLAYRKRMAWWLTLLLLGVSAVSHYTNQLPGKAALAGVLAGGLLLLRPQFHARSDRPSVAQGLQVLLASLAFTLVYGVAGLAMFDRRYQVHFDLEQAVRQTLGMFFYLKQPGLPKTRMARMFADSIFTIGATTMAYSLFMLLRPVWVRRASTAAERARARAIVEQHGCSTLARYTLFDDKSYFFSTGGSLVAFVQRSSTALVLGDPIGPPQDLLACLREFEAHCSERAWKPAFYQTLPDHLETYREAGYEVLPIGHDAVVNLANFVPGKSLRSNSNRLSKKGFEARVLDPPLTDEVMAELRSISDEWLAMMKGSEKRFSLGWFDDDYLRNGPLCVVRAPSGQITAFANVLPEYQKNEVTIDLMRRRSQVESGTMDYLFLSLMHWARDHRYATFNLGLSPLAGVGEQPDDPALERALHFLYQHLNRFYNFKGLHQFKEKFRPDWEPRFLVYPGVRRLPAVALTLIRADSGDDFWKAYLSSLLNRAPGEGTPAPRSQAPAPPEGPVDPTEATD